VKAKTVTPEEMDPSFATEREVFSGSKNYLEASQRMKISYNCIFDVIKYPFDTKECKFQMKINHRRHLPLKFIDDGPVSYQGESYVSQFAIGSITQEISNQEDKAIYTFTIPMTRLFHNQVIITFVPTFVLWLFGYLTLLIDVDNSSDRFTGAGTSLLVIVTLIYAIEIGLPKTSYVKYIDIWFLWHLTSIFLMISYHIILERLWNSFKKKVHDISKPRNEDAFDIIFENFREAMGDRVHPFDDDRRNHAEEERRRSQLQKMNTLVVMIFPTFNGIFYGIYFYLSL
jgi:hypothetical protein